jgi:cytochrome c oxidase subunit 2
MDLLTLAQFGDSFWMPVRASESAGAVDWLFNLILWISTFFFFLIVAVMILFVLRYRRRGDFKPGGGPRHSTTLELTWSIIPLIIVLALFYFGFRGFVEQMITPTNAMQINVTGQKWYWMFEYPDTGLMIDNELHVPVDTPINLVITSTDVIHSVYIPAFRLKKDAVPGRYNRAWFEADTPGEYYLFCAEYCGTQHAEMLAMVYVHPKEEFETWMEQELRDPIEELTPEQFQEYQEDPEAFIAANPDLGITEPLWQRGERLYTSKGCNQCHSVDGSAMIGPSFKGIWGATRLFTDGTEMEADENYIRSSILNPQEHIVEGYDPVMPTYQGRIKDREITALIEYIKTLSN